MSDIVLSPGVRQNLLALQDTANLLSITQNRLATGKKVNSALDNPANFFTSQALDTRATDLNALLDSKGKNKVKSSRKLVLPDILPEDLMEVNTLQFLNRRGPKRRNEMKLEEVEVTA